MGLGGFKRKLQNHHRDIIGHYSTTELNVADGSTNSYGSWVELIADIGAVPCILDSINCPLQDISDIDWSIQVGGGAASSEVVVAEVGQRSQTFSTYEEHAHFFNFSIHIPANSRVATRLKTGVSNDDIYVNLNFVEA